MQPEIFKGHELTDFTAARPARPLGA